MLFLHSLPQTQAALAVSIFFATFIYEDGATLLAATLSASGSLDPRIGLLTTFLGIWVGDMGLYGLGSSFGRRTAQWRWLQKHLRSESLAKAEAWFLKHGPFALVMSRAIPGSRLPLYIAAGALRFPVRMFARTTAISSAVWVSAIFAIWRFFPRASSGHQRLLPWLLTALVVCAPWLLSKVAGSFGGWNWNRESVRGRRAFRLEGGIHDKGQRVVSQSRRHEVRHGVLPELPHPMVRQLFGSALKGVSVEQGISGEEPGSKSAYVTTCHLLFDSVQAYQTSFAPHAQKITEDFRKYTNCEPLIQIGEVKLDRKSVV